MTIAILSHPDCLKHEMSEGHPEQPARIEVITDALNQAPFKDHLKFYQAPLATQEQLQQIHGKPCLETLFKLSPQSGFSIIDPDTLMNPFTLQAALRAAGAAAYAVDLVMQGEVTQAFCNIRPPGHHAEKNRAMGFCFFNNVALAVAQALNQYQCKRVAIIDFDVHHGNGTEGIFKTDERVLLCSAFQHPFYPFSGAATIKSHILNLPLPAGTDSFSWREHVEEAWFQDLANFKPEFLFFSAGFDGFVRDELANFCLVEGDYAWLTKQVLEFTKTSAEGRAVSLLEGGYDLESLGACVVAHVGAFR